jgi:hypothetical protein
MYNVYHDYNKYNPIVMLSVDGHLFQRVHNED